MKRIVALLIVVWGTTVCGLTVKPSDNCCPCPSIDNCCGDFCLGAELLIWRPLACEDDYGFTLGPPATTINHIFTVTPSFHLGFRVKARYDRNCWFLDSRYTWFQSSDINAVDRDSEIIFLQGSASTEMYRRASTRHRYGYQDVNLRAGWNCVGNQCCQVYSWIEGRYAQLTSKRTITGFGLSGVTQNALRINTATTSFDGGGLGIGFGFQAQILSCLEVSTELATLGLVGLRTGSWGTSAEFTGITISQTGDYQSKSSFIPAMDLRAKIAYVNSYCGWDFSLFFAWEVNYYWDGQLMGQPPVGFNGSAGVPPVAFASHVIGNRQCGNLGFGGPSVGFTICY